ncbi:MAG: TrkH family potassium uptake protein [Clostridia bacterium]|nr:TrkH family potassium uptake protein [Clostridia bacterium]
MNRRMVFHTVGLIVLLEAVLLLIPAAVSLLYREESAKAFFLTILFALLAGALLILPFRPKSRVIYAKEGFAITSMAWLILSAIGALPFFLSGQIPHYIDAFFETVSGFTTTGASILPKVEELDHGLLFWRSFTHWIGGMGVLVFLAAFLPNLSGQSIHILRAEMPGPTVGKLQPRVQDTAKILYIIYIVMTAVQILLLCAGGMDLFGSAIHAFGTAGTGGFGIYSDSAASLTPYQLWVITIFMLLFGVNFNLYYYILIRRVRAALRSLELWAYLGLVILSVTIICINVSHLYEGFGTTLRHSAFQVASIITTTGFSSVDFNAWPALSKSILLLLMFCGACAGSTAGGIKISRLILFFKNCHAEFRYMIHPRSVNVLKMDGKRVEKETQKGVMVYLVLYLICFAAIFFLISFNGFDFETNFSATAACFNNVGPGFAGVGPLSSFAAYSPFSKLVLSFAMLFGRLEIWPILLTLYPAAWRARQR